MNVAIQSRQDLIWMFEEQGEAIIYTPKIGNPIEILAIVDKVAENTPDYGYEGQITEKHHQFTVLSDVLGITAQHGDKITYNSENYTVSHIFPNNDDVLTIAAR
jgi:hypothetical protein